MLLHAGGRCFGRIADAAKLSAVSAGCDDKRRQAAIHTHPTATTVRVVLVVGVQVGCFDDERYLPPAAVTTDGRKADLGPVLGDHAAQPAGVVVHCDLPYARQCD